MSRAKNAILVVNLDDSLHPRSRDSIRHAASRWGCQFVEMVARPPGGLNVHPLYLKCWTFDMVPSADRILSLDSDVMIREDAPDPFDRFGDPHRVYAVKDQQPGGYVRNTFFPLYHDLGGDVNQAMFDFERYFNAGVVLMSRPFKAPLEKDFPTLMRYHPQFWYDQHYLNIVAQRFGLDLIPCEWNYFSFSVSGKMDHAYIYHWAGKITPGKVQWRLS